MCKPDSIGTKAAAGGDRSLFLFSLKQFDSHNGVPSATAQLVTGAILILALIAIEQSLRVFFAAIKVRRMRWILRTRTVPGQHTRDLLWFDSQSFRSPALRCFELIGFRPNIGQRNQSKCFGATCGRWCFVCRRSFLLWIQSPICLPKPSRRDYWERSKGYASCIRRANVHLYPGRSARSSLFHCLPNQEFGRHNCLERRHTIYHSPHSRTSFCCE